MKERSKEFAWAKYPCDSCHSDEVGNCVETAAIIFELIDGVQDSIDLHSDLEKLKREMAEAKDHTI